MQNGWFANRTEMILASSRRWVAAHRKPDAKAALRCQTTGVWMRGLIPIVLYLSLSFVGTSTAGEVDARLSSGQAYVNDSITLRVTIDDAQNYEPPKIPAIDGLDIESAGVPRISSQTTIINGRVSSRRSVTLVYEVTPLQPGTFEIPPMEVSVDGRLVKTPPLGFVASVSETGDLILVEIVGKQNRVYVGELLELTLKIWVRPYRDDELDRMLTEGEMWQMLSDRTSWGPFESAMTELAQTRTPPRGEKVVRKNPDGESKGYYLYEVDATIYPNKPGKIDASNVVIAMNYPLELQMERSRSMIDQVFGGQSGLRLVVTETRPIRATAEVDQTEVVPIPQQGQPESFQGAVGRYTVNAKTDLRRVAAGDPITLQLSVSGDGPLDSVQAPPLDRLTKQFRIDGQPLAGFVRDSVKYFTTTIRPIDATVDSVPAIEMSFFDPETETFQTVQTEPIAIEVEDAEKLAMDSIVGPEDRSGSSESSDETVAVSSPSSLNDWSPFRWLLANEAGPEVLQNQPRASIGPAVWLIYGLPVAIWLVVALVRQRGHLPTAWQRLRPAKQFALTQLDEVQTPDEIPPILQTYVRRSFGLNKQADWQTCLGVLRSRGHSDVAADLESLAHRCTNSAAATTNELERRRSLVDDAEQWLEAIAQAQHRKGSVSLRSPSRRTGLGDRKSPVAGVGRWTARVVIFAWLSWFASQELWADSAVVLLDSSQQATVLQEADQAYRSATQFQTQGDFERAQSSFWVAANKYQTLIDSGVENAAIHTNLGNVLMHVEQLGRGVAHYRIAETFAPWDLRTQVNLVIAQARLGLGFEHWFMPLAWLSAGGLMWWIGWWGLTRRTTAGRPRWWLCGLILVVSAGCLSVALDQSAPSTDLAISVVDRLPLRGGDAASFDVVEELTDVEGRSFVISQQRGEWCLIQLSSSQTGWTHQDHLIVIK